MKRRVEYYVVGDPFRNLSHLEKNVYDQDGNTIQRINILVSNDIKNIGKTERLAAELAESEPGSSAWSSFNGRGYFEIHLRKLWPKEEEKK